ncbi:peptidase family S49-domain-containing protein [Chytridium lagenaria]|nr:peptidase family S49-domain-containing protein [Chytridium lagenaria]
MEAVPTENKITGLLMNRSQQVLSLLDVLRVIRWAKNDDRIKGIVVDISSAGAGRNRVALGFAQTQEIRDAVKSFSEAKKEKFGAAGNAVVITDTFESQLLYYLASAFDEIRMEPLGMLPLVGFHIVQPFFKNTLDKLGIVFRSYAIGPWKSVNGTFTEPKGWTPPQRENLTDMLGDLNNQLISGIEVARGVTMDSRHKEHPETVKALLESSSHTDNSVKNLMDIAPLSAEECHNTGLIDRLAYKLAPFRDFLKSGKEGDQKVNTMTLRRYMVSRLAEMEEDANLGLPKGGKLPVTVGLVYLVGTIMRGDGPFASNTVARAIVDAARDKDVDAIVFRIASYGNVSASGGYYASAGCDRIFCSPGTITGSIGVAAARPHITPKFLNLVGDVHVDEISFTEGAKNLSILHDMGSDENQTTAWRRFRASTEAIYRVFKKRVTDGRGLTEEKLEDVAGGRVWSGLKAKEHGLVDALGGLEKAISEAAKLGIIAKYGSAEQAAEELRQMWKTIPGGRTFLADRYKYGHPAAIASSKQKNDENPNELLNTLEMDQDIQIDIFPKPRPFLKRLVEGDPLEEIIGDVTKDASTALMSWMEDVVLERIENNIVSSWVNRTTRSIATTAYKSTTLLTSTIHNPLSTASTCLRSTAIRFYRVHPNPKPETSQGRSVSAHGIPVSMAYFKLKSVLQESRVRDVARYQERFERNHDKKRRKTKQAEWRKYLAHVKSQVSKAKDLTFRLVF